MGGIRGVVDWVDLSSGALGEASSALTNLGFFEDGLQLYNIETYSIMKLNYNCSPSPKILPPKFLIDTPLNDRSSLLRTFRLLFLFPRGRCRGSNGKKEVDSDGCNWLVRPRGRSNCAFESSLLCLTQPARLFRREPRANTRILLADPLGFWSRVAPAFEHK